MTITLKPYDIDTLCRKKPTNQHNRDFSHAWIAASGASHSQSPTDRDKPASWTTSCQIDRVTERVKKRRSPDSRVIDQNSHKSNGIRCHRISRSLVDSFLSRTRQLISDARGICPWNRTDLHQGISEPFKWRRLIMYDLHSGWRLPKRTKRVSC